MAEIEKRQPMKAAFSIFLKITGPHTIQLVTPSVVPIAVKMAITV